MTDDISTPINSPNLLKLLTLIFPDAAKSLLNDTDSEWTKEYLKKPLFFVIKT